MNVNVFIDSGAHSLYRKKTMKEHNFDFFETDEFWKYVDDYALFLKKYMTIITVYANIDVIFNPELTWKTQKYLENEHKLSPLPVFHFGEDFKWLNKYLDNYDYVAIGGLGQTISKQTFLEFGDAVFSTVCDTKDKLPRCKTHGFAMTSLELMLRYPWYSVDSSSWALTGAFGSIIVPVRDLMGIPVYNEPPKKIKISDRAPQSTDEAIHFKTLSPAEQKYVLDYIESKGYKLGISSYKEVDKKYKLQKNERWVIKNKEVEVREELGVSNDHNMRDKWNIQYFVELEQHFRPWPWAFKPNKLEGFGL
jgi:hypothetical protein